MSNFGAPIPGTEICIGDHVFVAWSSAVRRAEVIGYSVEEGGVSARVRPNQHPDLFLKPDELHLFARDACAAAFNVLDEPKAEPLQLDMLRGRLREMCEVAGAAIVAATMGSRVDTDALRRAMNNAVAVL
jgi:predicted RNA-binding Zn ribbon-like protein